MKPYTTRYGRTIPPRVLRRVVDRLKEHDDFHRIMQEELRDPIPVHDEDLDEAYEVMSHCRDIKEEA